MLPGPLAAQTVWPDADWPRAEPAAVDLNAAPLDALLERAGGGAYGYVDHIVVVRAGRLVVDRAFNLDYRALSAGVQGELGCGWQSCPADGSWDHAFNYYHPDWHPYFQGRPVHTLQSVTKSVSATVLGVALHRGDVAGIQAPLLSFFPAYDGPDTDPRLRTATVEDLLTMRTGIEWHETDRPLGNQNTTVLLERSQDWTAFTFAQPMDAAPGERWVYNSGGSQLMDGIVRHATGLHLHDYARAHLFDPLGITEHHWKTTPRGAADALGGLYLRAEDLARIGLLMLRDGMWREQRLLPEGWAARATERIVELPDGRGYGYQWWRLDRGGHVVWAGAGFGGQYLLILPELDMVGVVYAWNIFGRGGRGMPGALIDAMVAAAGTSRH